MEEEVDNFVDGGGGVKNPLGLRGRVENPVGGTGERRGRESCGRGGIENLRSLA